jgi:hypothetical protein
VKGENNKINKTETTELAIKVKGREKQVSLT